MRNDERKKDRWHVENQVTRETVSDQSMMRMMSLERKNKRP